MTPGPALRGRLTGAVLLSISCMAVALPVAAQLPSFDSIASLDTTVPEGFTVVAVGDIILGRAITIREDPELEEVLELVRAADVAVGNMEGSLIDFRRFQGYPAAQHGGAYHVAPPAVAQGIAAMGFDLVTLANNHSLDWGVEGMRETARHLSDAGIAHAGTGETLGLARAPAYLETHAGRIALVGVASSYTGLAPAGHPTATVSGRPGLSALRLTRTTLVPADMLENLREIRDRLPGSTARDEPDEGEPLTLLGQRFAAGEEPAFTYEADEGDVREILRSVREGKQLSDFLILTQHAHEPGNWSAQPGDYLPELVRTAIEGGADMFVGHGPHRLRGIEIHEGRPIFYSLGNFIFHDNLTPVPHAMYERDDFDPWTDTDGDVNASMGARFHNDTNFKSVIAVSRFRASGEVEEIRLYPIELREGERLARRGAPRLAPPEIGRAVLEDLQELSAPFGTEIQIMGGVGVIRVPAAARSPGM